MYATPESNSNLAVLGATCDGGHPIAANPDPKCGATAEQLSSPCGANPAGSASDETEIQGGSTPAARLTPYAPLSGGPGKQEPTRSGVENRTNAGAGKIDTDMGDLLVPTSNIVPTQGHPHGSSEIGSGEPNSAPPGDLTGNSSLADGTGKA